MKSEVIVGCFLVALLLVSMFFINAGFSSTLLEQKNDWSFTTSTRDMSPRSLVGSDTGYYLTAGSRLNVSWSGDPNGWPPNPATSMRFYLLDSSQIGGFQWVVYFWGQREVTSGYLIKLDSWQTTVSCLINYTDTYYVIFCCEGYYYVFDPILSFPWIDVSSYEALVTSPPQVSISPSSATIDRGQSQLLTSTVSNGTPPYTYQWYLDEVAVPGANGPTWTFTSTSAGIFAINVKVNDSAGYSVYSSFALIYVNLPPSVSISPSSVVMDVGQSQLFASAVSGGTSPFGYQWYLNGVAVSGATSATWSFTPSFTGFYDVYVNVTDGVSFSAKSNNAIAIVNPPISVTISPTSVVMTVSQFQLFTSSVANGTPPYTYQWYLDDTPVSGATSPTWTFTPTTNGTYHVFLSVTDSVSGTAQSNAALVTVVSGVHDIALTGITNSKSGCLPFPTIGQNDTCQINVTVSNLGDYSESFNVTVYVNSIEIQRIAVIDLAPLTARVLTVNWSTIGFAKGSYTISALAEPVIGETNTTNNSVIGETVVVVVQGDINGDGIVDIFDIVRVAVSFGMTYPNPSWDPNADINNDGTVDIFDLVVVALHFGETG